MNHWTPKEVSDLLSAYVDGALDGGQAKELEAYLALHPEAARELQELRRIKHLLAAKKPVAPNPYFWTRLSAEMESRKREEENLLPFPKKYMPLATILGAVAVLAVGIAVFQQRGPLREYFSRTSQQVQEAYEAGLLKGSILPLFTNVDKDQVMQFALFGTLPLDAKAETALRVDEASQRGYRIDVGVTADQKPPQVTVDDFRREVRPTLAQAELIDSVLEEARLQIESAAFYGENNALAIDPELTKLNRVVIANIAAVLAPPQRARFDRFLQERNASYAVTAARMRTPVVEEPRVREFEQVRRQRDYIVLTPESLMLAPLDIDMERVARFEEPEMSPTTPPSFHHRLEKLMHPQAKPRVVVQAPGSSGRMRIVGDQDFFQIQFEHGPPGLKGESLGVWVAPRPRKSKVFKFEYREPEGTMEVFQVAPADIEIEKKMDSVMRKLIEEGVEHERAMRMFDSVWNKRARSFTPPRTPKRGIRMDSIRRKEEGAVQIYRPQEEPAAPGVRVMPSMPNVQPKPRKKSEKPIDT